jgi:Flp pilus assembly protein TadG
VLGARFTILGLEGGLLDELKLLAIKSQNRCAVGNLMPTKPSMRQKFGLLSLIGKLAKDETGSVVIWFTLVLLVIMGMIGLALDGGAYFHLNSDLHELADAAAIAGAAELDGASDAITRATDRAENLLSNDPHWSNIARSGLQITTPTFYSSLNPDTVTTDAARARFIKVDTVTREVAPSFLAAVGATANAQTSASAVAGSSYVACNVQPLMVCNPWEQAADPNFANHVTPGTMLRLMEEGGNSFAPGDFGLLDPAGQSHSSANEIRNLLSQTQPNSCYVNNISPRTGQVTNKVLDGINVRFNMPPSTGGTGGQDQTSAPNVIKGTTNTQAPSCPKNQWNPDPPDPSKALPLDQSMNPVGSMQVGNGTMDAGAKNAYWSSHHGVGTTWPAGVTTRYAAYLLEQGIGGTAPAWAPGSEPHAPYCTPTTTGNSDRRIISAAVVNCIANNVQGNTNTNLLSAMYVDFFVTKPADNTIYLEFVRVMTPQNAGTQLHHVVQLYR